jgi:hypothetical protein
MAGRFLTTLRVRSFLILIGLFLGGILSEIGARLYSGETFRFRNFLIQDLDFLHCHYWPTVYDPVLGWIPRPNSKEPGNYWGMEILEDGFRSNGEGALSAAGPTRDIIAVGDSFTFGDQVTNHETWPAQLEKRLARSVTNAGVYNYGIDQSALRAKILLSKYRPKLLIISVYTEDLVRAQLSVSKGLAKPYFEMQGDELVVRNNPVPLPQPLVQRLGWAKGLLGYSYAIHRIMKYVSPEMWFVGRGGDTYVAEESREVSCRLLREVQREAATTGTRIMVLLQYGAGDGHHPFDSLLQCMSDSKIPVLDLYPPLKALRDANFEEYESLFIGHMSPKGNAWVAERLATFLQSTDLLNERDVSESQSR